MTNHPNRSKKAQWAVMVDTTNSGQSLVQWGDLHKTKKEACSVLHKLAFTGRVERINL